MDMRAIWPSGMPQFASAIALRSSGGISICSVYLAQLLGHWANIKGEMVRESQHQRFVMQVRYVTGSRDHVHGFAYPMGRLSGESDFFFHSH